MNKIIISVPGYVDFISNWNEFSFQNFQGPCIIDKEVPGCGMTEFALDSKSGNVILCSPRKILLSNKHEQHPDTTFIVSYDDLDKDSVGFDRDLREEDIERQKKIDRRRYSSVIDQAREYEKFIEEFNYFSPDLGYKNSKIKNAKLKVSLLLENYRMRMNNLGLPCKILVTYDSFPMVKSILGNDITNFSVVVDEFQAILQDSRFKSDAENKFLDSLHGLTKVYFISATPILDKYLGMIKFFKGMNFYELDWKTNGPGRVVKPDIDVKPSPSFSRAIKGLIRSYRLGKSPKTYVTESGTSNVVEFKSKEAVFYLNSVHLIIQAIASNKLNPDEVNILCANTEENQKKISEKIPGHTIGRVPLKNEPRKMFTFCTRTVYLGADFYSDNACSFVFSDSNKDYLAVDISQDLPQILGRQRLDSNPWRHSATFYYRNTDPDNITGKDQLRRIIISKLRATKTRLKMYDDIATKSSAKNKREFEQMLYESVLGGYTTSYVSLNVSQDPNEKRRKLYTPVLNNLVYVSELRAYDIQQVDYKDRFSLFSKLGTIGTTTINDDMKQFLDIYEKLPSFTTRCSYLCENKILTPEQVSMLVENLPDTDIVKISYLKLGPEVLKSLDYKLSSVRSKLNEGVIDEETLKTLLRESGPKVGDKISLVDAKEMMTAIYEKLGSTKKAKATDLAKYYELKPSRYTKEDGVRVNGFIILGSKDGEK